MGPTEEGSEGEEKPSVCLPTNKSYGMDPTPFLLISLVLPDQEPDKHCAGRWRSHLTGDHKLRATLWPPLSRQPSSQWCLWGDKGALGLLTV